MTTPRGLTRLRIADLIVRLPGDLDLPDADVLETHLRPFAWEGEGAADVVVERVALPPDEASLPPGSFRIDVNRLPGRPVDDPSVRPHWLTERDRSMLVRGACRTALEAIAAAHLGLAHALPARDGLMLHASAVNAAGWAFVFPGVAEAGKSTAASRFAGGTILTDERCAVRRVDGRWTAYPVPMWGGKYKPVSSKPVPLAMLVVVRKNAPLAVRTLPTSTAIGRLAPAIVHNHYDGMKAERVLGALAQLATEVPVVELAYAPGDSFTEVLLSQAPAVVSSGAFGGN